MPSELSNVLTPCIGFFLNVVISIAIGAAKRDILRGLVWGVLLGPIGWLITILLPSGRKPKDEEAVTSRADRDLARTPREDKTPRAAKPNDKELCYLCGKRLAEEELESRVCQACR